MSSGHCGCGSFEFDPVTLESIGTPPYELPVMACVACGVVYAFADSLRAERHRLFMAEVYRAASAYRKPGHPGDRDRRRRRERR